ncbi:LysE family translocator [Ramlibacter sp. G-1-2-2]|uniref:LysE family translocator n=1 Tax=Ramlibacter agri TaxID=2728837 RepID=A0A848H3B0_9BURK|nr:LysE family translocator [Ramlibacter agri]NML44051.1 LysE family translocator [Ramlibacter agri]
METIWLFALLVFGIIALPGMDMAFVLASSLAGGRGGGFAALAGIVAGGLAHVVMGVLGVGLLLQALPAAYRLLLLAGAAYLAWIAWKLWRHPGALTEVPDTAQRSRRQTFWRALATCLLNPKAYVFMVAVFPQFLRPGQGPLAMQAALLWGVIAVTQVLVYGAVALGAGGLRARLARSAGRQMLLARQVALLLGGTALWALWHGVVPGP